MKYSFHTNVDGMNRILRFYDYEQCFGHYTKRMMNIRQAKIHGEVILAKPVLLLALIDGIDKGVFVSNRFTINEWLEERYLSLMIQYTKESQFDTPAGIEKPFWHLESDGFWHLLSNEERSGKSKTPSKLWLKEHVEYARFDDELWILLQHQEWRTRLRDYIIEHKLTDDHWLGKLAAEGLGMLAAVIIAA